MEGTKDAKSNPRFRFRRKKSNPQPLEDESRHSLDIRKLSEAPELSPNGDGEVVYRTNRSRTTNDHTGVRASLPPAAFAELDKVLSDMSRGLQLKNSGERRGSFTPRSAVPPRPPRPNRPRTGSSPSTIDPLAEIRTKLAQEETTLQTEKKHLRLLVDSNGSAQRSKIKELQERIKERTELISALKQNLSLQNEHYISNGYLRVQRITTDADETVSEPVRYWTVIAYPKLQFFHSEWVREIPFPSGARTRGMN